MTARTWLGEPLTPGLNVDPMDPDAGVACARRLGYDDPHDLMVIHFCLLRWKRGEEEEAERQALEQLGKHHFTQWRMIVAAAVVDER